MCTECDDYYQLTDDTVCEACSSQCVHCDRDFCTECDDQWFIAIDGSCTQDCGDGYFADVDSGSCV